MTHPKTDLPQGTLEMLTLNDLSLVTLDGYGVIQRIRRLSGETRRRTRLSLSGGLSD